ncbi:retrotransposon protein, putative, ty1-copia subclass [Tanacetum coccineum]
MGLFRDDSKATEFSFVHLGSGTVDGQGCNWWNPIKSKHISDIKPTGGIGLVKNVTFSNIQVENVNFPIVINQYYCDKSLCQNQTGSIAIKGVTFDRIIGTYSTQPIHLACSNDIPCTDIDLSDIQLKPSGPLGGSQLQHDLCWNSYGNTKGPLKHYPPKTCCAELRKMIEKPPACHEIYDLVVDTLHSGTQAPGKSVNENYLNTDFGDFEEEETSYALRGEDRSDLTRFAHDYEKGIYCLKAIVMGINICIWAMEHKQGGVFKAEVELQLGKKIKALRSDRGGEYLSQEFKDYLSENGIVQNLTSPYTPQQNGVFKGEIVWGCEAYVKRDSADKLKQRSVKCIFVGYPKETMGYYFYFPPENKVIVARYGDFLERDLISQEFSGEIVIWRDHVDTLPSENTSEIPVEPESLGPPPELIPVRRSERPKNAPNRLCLNMEVEDDEVGDLGEPANYRAAMIDPDKVLWQGAMDEEMKSMKKKTDMDGKVHTYKARLVAKGCTQTYGIDYEETFSPVADIRAIRILIAIAAYYDYEIWQMDVKTAFLNGLDFIQNRDEPCVYRKASGSDVVFLILYVDDILIMGNNIPKLKEVKDYLGKCFSVKDLGEAAYILGIKIYRDRSLRLIGLNQRSIMYAVRCTRPDVAFAQNLVSRYQQNPGKLHWVAVKHILKYLRNTKDMFLVYGGIPDTELDVTGFCDASWQCDKDDTKSQTGYVFVINGGAVDWKSKKQTTIAMHATQSEYMAASEAAMEAVWIRKFVEDLGVMPSISKPINMYCDNSAAIIFANEPGVMKGARHFLRRYHYVREQVESGEIKLIKVHTDKNLADAFTKALPRGKVNEHANGIGLRLASSFMHICD